MIRHAAPHRTIERDRLGTPQGEPTPEQLADDGRSDGIPVVTIAELNAAREARERRLTELAGAPLRRYGGNRTGKPLYSHKPIAFYYIDSFPWREVAGGRDAEVGGVKM